jgi:hypothetical protein
MSTSFYLMLGFLSSVLKSTMSTTFLPKGVVAIAALHTVFNLLIGNLSYFAGKR